MSFATEMRIGADKITVKPVNHKDRFPVFDEVEIMPNGDVIGWKSTGTVLPVMMQLGRVYEACEFVSQTTTEVIFKRIQKH